MDNYGENATNPDHFFIFDTLRKTMLQYVRDSLQLTSTIKPSRIMNAWSTYWGFQKALHTKNSIHPGLPWALSIEPTTSCNLRCPQCPSGLRSFTRPTGMIEEHTYRKVIDQLDSSLLYLMLYFQGEPYLHPSFLEIVKYANAKKIYTATSTNAHFLNPANATATVKSGLKKIIVSVDGTDQKVYQKYRIGGQLDKVLDGIRNLVSAKRSQQSSTPFITLQFIVFEHNKHQMAEVEQLAKELKVDKLEFKSAQVYDYENGSELIPEDSKYSRYEMGANDLYQIKNDHRNKCWKMWHSCVMTWDGNIVPCCFDKDAKYVMGNVHQTSFPALWNGTNYLDFRRKLFENRSEIDICKNCTEGLKK